MEQGPIVYDIERGQGTPQRTYITPQEEPGFEGLSDGMRLLAKTFGGNSSGSSKKEDYSFLYDATDKLRDFINSKYTDGDSLLNSDVRYAVDKYYKAVSTVYSPDKIEKVMSQKGLDKLLKPISKYDELQGEGQSEQIQFSEKLGKSITGGFDARENIIVGAQVASSAERGLRDLAEAGAIQDPELQKKILNAKGKSLNYSILIQSDLKTALDQMGGFMNAQQFDAWKNSYIRSLSDSTNLPLETANILVDQYTGWYLKNIEATDKATQATSESIGQYLGMLMDIRNIDKMQREFSTGDGKTMTYGELMATEKVSPELAKVLYAANPDLVKAIYSDLYAGLGRQQVNIKDVLGNSGMAGKLIRNVRNQPMVNLQLQGEINQMQGEVNEQTERAALEEDWKRQGVTPSAMNAAMVTYINTAYNTVADDWLDKDKELQTFTKTATAQGVANNKVYEGSWVYGENGLVLINPETGVPMLFTYKEGILKPRSHTDLTNKMNEDFADKQLRLIPQFLDAAAIRTGKSRAELADIFNKAQVATSDAAIARMRQEGTTDVKDFGKIIKEDSTRVFAEHPSVRNMFETEPVRNVFEDKDVKITAVTNARRPDFFTGEFGKPKTVNKIQVKPSDTVSSPADGTVIYDGTFKGYGHVVILKESAGRNWIYFGDGTRLAKNLRVGSEVKEGEALGVANYKGEINLILMTPEGWQDITKVK